MSSNAEIVTSGKDVDEFYFVTAQGGDRNNQSGIRRSRTQRAVSELLLRDKFHVSSNMSRKTSSVSNASFPAMPVDPKVRQRQYWQPPRQDHYTDQIDSKSVLASQPSQYRYYPDYCLDRISSTEGKKVDLSHKSDMKQTISEQSPRKREETGQPWWRRQQQHDKQHQKAEERSSTVSNPTQFAQGLRFDMHVGKHSHAKTDYKRKEDGDRVDSTNVLSREEGKWYGLSIDSNIAKNHAGHIRGAYLGSSNHQNHQNHSKKKNIHNGILQSKVFRRKQAFTCTSEFMKEVRSKAQSGQENRDNLASIGLAVAFHNFTKSKKNSENMNVGSTNSVGTADNGEFHPFQNILPTMKKTKYSRRELLTLWYKFRVLCNQSGSEDAMNCNMLQYSVQRLGMEDQQLLARVCHIVDDDRSGSIEWGEFLQTVISMEHGDISMQCEFLVQCYDVDGDGVIGYDDLRTLFYHSSMLFIKEQKETQKLRKELQMQVSEGFFRPSDNERQQAYRRQVDDFIAHVSADLSHSEKTANDTAHDIINTFVDGVFKLQGKTGDDATISAEDLIKFAQEHDGDIDIWTIFGRTPLNVRSR